MVRRVIAGGLAAAALWCAPNLRAQSPPPVVVTSFAEDTLKDPAPPAKAETPPAATAAPKAEPAEDVGDMFKKIPPVRPMPRPGNFFIPPAGPGYYSLLDVLTGEYREKPPRFPYPPFGLMPLPFYDADFRYLDDPKNTQFDWSDALKRIRCGDDCWMFSTGGMAWARYMDEGNSRLTRTDNSYTLLRARAWADLWYRDQVRLFAEGMWVDSTGEELAPLPIDVNRFDFLNLFAEVQLPFGGANPAYLRVGRQEILLGSQRLLGTLDWANTRRTFQGARVTRTGEEVDYDLFWVQPVVPNPDRLDSVDNNQNLFGAWVTYRPRAGQSFDLYYLFLDNTNRLTQQGLTRAPFNVHTVGTRAAGDVDGAWLYDAEVALQFGHRGARDIAAGMATVGGGYHWKDCPLNPTAWVYFDYASGDRDPGNKWDNTFTQLFPFGHYYLGWTDQVGRQNIRDLNAHLFLYPTNWITVWGQYHCFWLDSATDALYNAAGTAIRRDPTGRAGTRVGQEMDLTVNVHLGPHSDFLAGYSKLWGGGFLKGTSNATRAPDTDLLYAQYSVRW